MDDSAANVNIFFSLYTRCDFFRSSLLTIQRRRKNQAYQDSLIPLLHAERGHNFTWSCLFYSQHSRMSLWFYMDKLSILHKDARRQNHSSAHGHSPTCFNAICFFCRIIRRYLRKKITTCNPCLRDIVTVLNFQNWKWWRQKKRWFSDITAHFINSFSKK